jgi:hypothetical protein
MPSPSLGTQLTDVPYAKTGVDSLKTYYYDVYLFKSSFQHAAVSNADERIATQQCLFTLMSLEAKKTNFSYRIVGGGALRFPS